MSDTVDNVLNTVTEAAASGEDEPADVVVNEEVPVASETEEAPVASETEEAPVASETEEAPVASETEEAPVASETEEAPVASEVEEAPVASETEETPVVSETEEASVEPEVAPIEQVVSDIRDILSEEPVASASGTGELTEDLKQRIAELDYLRECCGNWVGLGRAGKRNFLTAWKSKSVSVDSNVNYEDTLNQLEKLPELVKLWAEGKIKSNSNHFKNIQSYTLDKSLFNEKNVTECVEVLEELINLLINCANGKMRVTQIIEVIDNLY